MKKVLFIALFFLAGCTSEPTVNYDIESDIIEILEIMKDMESRIEDMESKIDDLEYQNETIVSDYEDLRFELEYVQENEPPGGNIYIPTPFKGLDKDIDNDGLWDHDKGGIDRDLDNDGLWDN